jgi:predicted Zn-dependent peptidase
MRDIDSEREVILEEIAMYEDEPQEKVFDILGDAVFPGHPLGRPIIGRAEVVADTPVTEIARFHASRYTPSNIVIAAAGAVDHEAFVELARARVPNGGAVPAAAPVALAAPAADGREVVRRRFEEKDTEQYHVCIGGHGPSRHDERKYALRVLDTIFGGTSSSRLFQEVREQRGLAYAVYSFSSAYQDSGQIGLYVGTRGDNLAEAMSVITDELTKLQRERVSDDELTRAKENLKGRILLSLESTSSRMNRLGSELLAEVPLLSLDEVVAKIDAVTVDDVAELAQELWRPELLTCVGIGPDARRFDDAVAPLCAVSESV